MPRYEKKGKTKEQVFELLPYETRVYVAEGERAIGEKEWQFKERGQRTMTFDDEAKAQAFYKTKVADLEKKKFVCMGDGTPITSQMREKAVKQREAFLGKGTPGYAFRSELEKKGKVRWTKKMKTGEDFWEIALEGTTIIISMGTVGSKGKTKKHPHTSRDSALDYAAITMTMTQNVLGFGP